MFLVFFENIWIIYRNISFILWLYLWICPIGICPENVDMNKTFLLYFHISLDISVSLYFVTYSTLVPIGFYLISTSPEGSLQPGILFLPIPKFCFEWNISWIEIIILQFKFLAMGYLGIFLHYWTATFHPRSGSFDKLLINWFSLPCVNFKCMCKPILTTKEM